ncbi:hypothetical protein BRC87_01665 [Halobacteriales archaeon QS_4_66_20]|nr:MAG: hypothetical protein BRC87_01665 [Halobacteriales archaeon QS_4_66_20]
MTDPEPIPPAEFSAALEALDRAAFASFVGELRAVTADEVDVDPPLVTVQTGETRTELLVGAPDADPGIDPDGVDGIVTTAREPSDIDVDASLITPSDLRQRLLWSLRVDDAQALCERTLGVPAYSTRYADSPPAPEPSARDPARQNPPQGESPPRRVGRPVVLVGLLALLVLAAGVGAVYVAGAGDSITALLGGDDAGSDDAGSDDAGSDDAGSDQARVTASATRDVGLEPTCNRSYLHVVQIQMNALKYNNETTNDGIRTVRQFASPSNRRAVGSVSDYARLISDGSFAPMLSWDSVRYTPERVNDTAWVEVITFENATETGRYEFRLTRLGSDTERYEGCWMTDSVRRALTTDGRDAIQPDVISIDRAKSGARDASAMVKLVQFMDATERMIVEETVHVDG